MGVHILTVLGTSLYEPVVYSGENKNEIESDFIQCALVNEFYNEVLDGGKVTIFVTDRSYELNWDDRTYNAKEEQFAANWFSERKNEVAEGVEKKGLKTTLEDLFPLLKEKVELVKIPDMKTEGEIWDVFNKIYSAINENDDIVFDITHSFRSIPMLAVTVINYAKIVKKCHLKGVYYGAYEAAQNNENKKIAPIINLTAFNEILEWTYAADAFMTYGNVGKFNQVYLDKMKSVPEEQRREWGPIKQIIKDMDNIALGISTCRGADSMKTKGNNKSDNSVKQAYQKLKRDMGKTEQVRGREIVPMTNLLSHVADSFESFDKQKDYEIGCEIIKWCIKNHMIQQGYTSLEETIKTYVCELYDLDDIKIENRQELVSLIFTGAEKQSIDNRDDFFRKMVEEDKFFSNAYCTKFDDKQKSIAEKMIKELPAELFILVSQVKKYRNDINHMGFNESPRDSKKLEAKLKEFYDRLEKIIEG